MKESYAINQTHTIAHSSAMYYQNVNVIQESCKKFNNDQKCKIFFQNT